MTNEQNDEYWEGFWQWRKSIEQERRVFHQEWGRVHRDLEIIINSDLFNSDR